MAILIMPLRYSKAELAHVPEPELLLHLAAGQLLNDFHFLGRLAIVAMNQASAGTPEGRASVGMALMLLRQLAGRTYEAGRLLKHLPFKRVLREYRPVLTDRARSALDELEPYFDGKNLLADVRNKTAAHLDVDVFKSGFRELPENEELIDYNSNLKGNVYYHSSAMAGAMSLKKLAGTETYMDALDRVHRESIKITGLLDSLLGDWMGAFMDKWLPQHVEQMKAEAEVIADPPSIESAVVPMFTGA